MVKDLFNIEQKIEMYIFFQINEIQEAFGTMRKFLMNWISWG